MKISTPGWRDVLPGGREKASTLEAARIRTRTLYRVRSLLGKFDARDVAAQSQVFKSNRLAATVH
jgi:hypothetical protein